MRHDREIEYIPLDSHPKKPAKKRGFLTRLFDCLTSVEVIRWNHRSKSSSGEEVEEEVIEF